MQFVFSAVRVILAGQMTVGGIVSLNKPGQENKKNGVGFGAEKGGDPAPFVFNTKRSRQRNSSRFIGKKL